MEDIETTTDGRYYFKLAGSVRVRLGEVLRDSPYRLVRAEEIPERPVDEADPAIRRAKLDLLASQVCLVRELTGSDTPRLVLDERMSFASAVNGACASLPTEPAVRQALLELDDLMERHRRAAAILDEIFERVVALKSAEDGGAGSAARTSVRRDTTLFPKENGAVPFQSTADEARRRLTPAETEDQPDAADQGDDRQERDQQHRSGQDQADEAGDQTRASGESRIRRS